jgi:hypothetical protein
MQRIRLGRTKATLLERDSSISLRHKTGLGRVGRCIKTTNVSSVPVEDPASDASVESATSSWLERENIKGKDGLFADGPQVRSVVHDFIWLI